MAISIPDLIQILLDDDVLKFGRAAVGAIAHFLTRFLMRSQGVYEVLAQERTVEIHDQRGYRVTVDTLQRVRFLQNQVAAVLEYVWGDGNILAEFTCTPGAPVDFYKEGSRWIVLISLREVKNRGDELVLKSHREVQGGFTRERECWEADVYHPTERISVTLIFPKSRRCRRVTITERNTGKVVPLGSESFRFLPDGRQQLHWEMRRPKLHERYLLAWEW